MKNEWMLLAIKEAKKDKNEVPVGAVLIKDKQVIAAAHNECVAQNGICHAELLAIEQGLKKLGTTYLEGCELYVTKEPCLMCFGACVNARIKRVYFGCYEPAKGRDRPGGEAEESYQQSRGPRQFGRGSE